jgi:hypothetical protein
MTDFRALCAELVDAIDASRPYATPLLDRARAALAEPQPAADGEVAATGKSGLQDGPAVQSREPASVIAEPSDEELRRLYCELFMLRCDPLSLGTGPVRFARAVLARWGNYPAIPDSSPQPIPVSERLPEAGGCDAEGRCWQEELGTATEPPAWNLVPCSRVIEAPSKRWLPAHALPLPKEVDR